MNKEELKKLTDDGLSIYDISKKYKKGYSTIRYWLKKYELKTNESITREVNKNNINEDQKLCVKCNRIKSKNEYYNSGSRSRGYCKKCLCEYHQNRLRKIKIKMILYKGGGCERCNLELKDSHYSVFDFHHLDPSTKDPNFSGIKSQKWEKIKNEIDKCKLLCSNCHRITHAEMSLDFEIDDVLIKMNNKSGKSLWSEVNKKDNTICNCGNLINSKSNSCRNCYKKSLRRQERPILEILLKDVEELGYTSTGKKYGVSDNSIRKWIKNYQN
jgi:transposase